MRNSLARTCRKLALPLLAFLLAICSAGTSHAQLAKWECPEISPIDGKTKIFSKNVLHLGEYEEGGYWDFFEDAYVEEVYFVTIDFETNSYRGARLECRYGISAEGPLVNYYVPIDGLLLRCEWFYMRLPTGGFGGGRYWCTSRPGG